MMGKILLWLLVLWAGIQLGGGLYEKQVIVPQWASVPAEQLQEALARTGQKDSATRFWAFVSPPVALLALMNLVFAWRSSDAVHRPWWLAAAVLMTVYSVATYAYFVPAMLRLWQAGTLPPEEVRSAVWWWTRLNYLRLVLGVSGWFAALKALSLLGASGTALPGPR